MGGARAIDAAGYGYNGIRVARFARGDGVTVEADQLIAAINKAGVNGTLIFEPRKTYVIDRPLHPLQGQTWIGNGAALKRAPFVGTVLTVASTGGATTTFYVTAGTGRNFRVGQYVSLWQAGDPTVNEANNYQVTKVTPNTVTVANAPASSWAIGDHLDASTRLVQSDTATDVAIVGLEVDGNRSDYTGSFHSWINHEEVRLDGHRSMLDRCYIHDTQSEGALVAGDGTVIRNNRFMNCGGNGVHVSESNGLVIDGNYFYNTNLEGTTPGHADGCISISTAVIDMVVTNNYADGNANSLAFIGGFNDTTDGTRIVANKAVNCLSAVDATTTWAAASVTFLVTGNTFDNCVEINFDDNSGTDYVGQVLICNNILIDTRITCSQITDLTIAANTITNATDNTNAALELLDCTNVAVTGNAVHGGNNNVKVTTCTGVSIKSNTLQSVDSGGAVTRIVNIASGSNVTVVGNNIIAGSGMASSPSVVYINAAATLVAANNIDVNASGSAVGIDLRTNADGSVVVNNIIDNPAAGGSAAAINAAIGADNCVIANNTATAGGFSISANTGRIVGNSVIGTGKTITVNAGATSNLVRANVTNVDIVDNGTTTNAGAITASVTVAGADNYYGI